MYTYLDPTASPQERAKDLLSRMNLEEKIDQLSCGPEFPFDADKLDEVFPHSYGCIAPVFYSASVQDLRNYNHKIQETVMRKSRFGIPALIHTEAISGGVFAGATAFPTAIAQASTWNPDLVEQMSRFVREQLKSVGVRHALSSVFDLCRDPRWGRLTETYGEDETLSSAMSCAFVRGMQGGDLTQAVAATGKHFVGHGAVECGLNMNQNNITDRELREVHCKPFQAAITEEGLMSVMPSYCSINREPVVSSYRLLTKLLRDELGFDGIAVSDYVAIDRLLNPYQTADNYVDAGIQAISAGLDIELPAPKGISRKLMQAVEEGKLAEEVINRAVFRLLVVKFKLGLFEHPFEFEQPDAFENPKGEELQRTIAREEMTLLKNDGPLLPLSKKVKRIAIVGPHANRVRPLFGTYSVAANMDLIEDRKNDARLPAPYADADWGKPWYQAYPGEYRETPNYVEDMIRAAYPAAKTLFEAVRDALPDARVQECMGISYTGYRCDSYERALECAAQADVVILTLGGQNGHGVTATIGEGVDSSDIGLPGKQESFARDVYALHRPTVVVHMDGKPLSNQFVLTHFDTIMEIWQPGEYGFEELTKILFGDAAPCGRLPVCVARSSGTLPSYYAAPRGTGYPSAGRFGIASNRFGYIDTDAHPYYAFGHGLTYTTFEYRNARCDGTVSPDGVLHSQVDIANTGDREGTEVVQMYISDCLASVVRSEILLAGFARVTLAPGKTKTVHFDLPVSQLAFLDLRMDWKVEGGKMKLYFAASSADLRTESDFVITGDRIIDPTKRAFYTLGRVEE